MFNDRVLSQLLKAFYYGMEGIDNLEPAKKAAILCKLRVISGEGVLLQERREKFNKFS